MKFYFTGYKVQEEAVINKMSKERQEIRSLISKRTKTYLNYIYIRIHA